MIAPVTFRCLQSFCNNFISINLFTVCEALGKVTENKAKSALDLRAVQCSYLQLCVLDVEEEAGKTSHC